MPTRPLASGGILTAKPSKTAQSLATCLLPTIGLTVPSFCEEDYAITSYIAEFISTISNAAYGKQSICPVSARAHAH